MIIASRRRLTAGILSRFPSLSTFFSSYRFDGHIWHTTCGSTNRVLPETWLKSYRKAEFVRHGSCPTRNLSDKFGVMPAQVTDRNLSETDYPVSCGLPILTNSRGTKAILVSFHDAQSGCGAHTSSLSCRPRSKTTPNHYSWTFQNTGVLSPPPLQSVQG